MARITGKRERDEVREEESKLKEKGYKKEGKIKKKRRIMLIKRDEE